MLWSTAFCLGSLDIFFKKKMLAFFHLRKSVNLRPDCCGVLECLLFRCFMDVAFSEISALLIVFKIIFHHSELNTNASKISIKLEAQRLHNPLPTLPINNPNPTITIQLAIHELSTSLRRTHMIHHLPINFYDSSL